MSAKESKNKDTISMVSALMAVASSEASDGVKEMLLAPHLASAHADVIACFTKQVKYVPKKKTFGCNPNWSQLHKSLQSLQKKLQTENEQISKQ